MGDRRGAVEVLGVMRPNPDFWRGKRVLLTGHTGFKGAWLALMLTRLGAEVTGLALPPEPGPALFPILAPALRLADHAADLRDAEAVRRITAEARPQVVLHLAAQALVGRGYADPAGTFASNVTGTIHLLEALRGLGGVEAAVMITTDKVYRNEATGRRFREDDPLGGEDPYSASKAACELAVACWRASFARELPPLVTARAGNVIGGGDFAPTRLIPDLVRAAAGTPLVLRYPSATRPWQHVLDVLTGYLLLAEHAAAGTVPAAVNFAPPGGSESTVLDIISAFSQAFGADLPWTQAPAPAPEAALLALDASLAADTLGWRPRLDATAMIAETAVWYAAWRRGENMLPPSLRDVETALS